MKSENEIEREEDYLVVMPPVKEYSLRVSLRWVEAKPPKLEDEEAKGGEG